MNEATTAMYDLAQDTNAASSNPFFMRTFGIAVLLLSVLFLVLQLLFITVNSKRCGLATNLSFTLMVFISILDCVQLVIHAFIGSLFAFDLEVPHFVKIIGAVMAASWITMVTSTLLLTVDRLVVTLYPLQAKSALRPRISRVLLIVLHLLFTIYLLFNLTPFSSLDFSRDHVSWYYNTAEYPYSSICSALDSISNFASAIFTTAIYIVIFIVLSRKRPQIRKSKDVGVTLLVFCFCGYQIICFVIWEFVFPALEQELYLSCVNLIMWVIWNGASALLYMLFSVSFRRDLVRMIRSIGGCPEAIVIPLVSRKGPS